MLENVKVSVLKRPFEYEHISCQIIYNETNRCGLHHRLLSIYGFFFIFKKQMYIKKGLRNAHRTLPVYNYTQAPAAIC